MKKTTLDIKGMQCASCSAVINKALVKQEGVADANVNLSTNKATIDYDESKLTENDLIGIVKSKGYGAEKSRGEEINQETLTKEKEIKNLKHRLYVSLVFAIPVFILGMFFMSNPIPYQEYIIWFLATPVQFVLAWPMYVSAFNAWKG